VRQFAGRTYRQRQQLSPQDDCAATGQSPAGQTQLVTGRERENGERKGTGETTLRKVLDPPL